MVISSIHSFISDHSFRLVSHRWFLFVNTPSPPSISLPYSYSFVTVFLFYCILTMSVKIINVEPWNTKDGIEPILGPLVYMFHVYTVHEGIQENILCINLCIIDTVLFIILKKNKTIFFFFIYSCTLYI